MPFSEAERVAQAQELRPALEDARFADVTAMALRLFDVDAAMVSLVGDEVSYHAKQGTLLESHPVDGSFCRAAMKDGELVVEDARADARFANTPIVKRSPGVRFYAGFALRGPAGARVGALCLIDTKPRAFGDADRRQFRMLAAMAGQTLSGGAPDTDMLLRAVMDSIDTEVALLDQEGTILTVNESWRAFSKENGGAGDYEGTNYLRSFDGTADRTSAAIKRKLERVLLGADDDMEHEYPCHNPDEKRWFLMRAHRVEWNGPPRVVVMHDDVTDRREAEQARQERLKARVRIEEQGRSAQFSRRVLDTLAHELHTPLTPMRLRLHTLSMTELPERAERSVQSLLQDLGRLESLSARILDVVRLVAPKTPVAPEEADTQTLRRIVRETARGLGLDDRVEGPDDVPAAEIRIDQDWIRRVVEQFLSNAARYSDGQIQVRVSKRRNMVRLEVRDDGIGLAPQDAQQLFRLFGQAHDPKTNAHVGPALGLYVAARIIEAHRGHIGLDSPGTGEGATAWFEVPMVLERPGVPPHLLDVVRE